MLRLRHYHMTSTLLNLVKEYNQTLYSWLPERTLYYLFSPWATYYEIFHTHKPMGILSGGLNNVNLRYDVNVMGVYAKLRVHLATC